MHCCFKYQISNYKNKNKKVKIDVNYIGNWTSVPITTIKIKEEHSFKTLFYLIQLVLTLPRLLNLLKNYSVKGSVFVSPNCDK